MWIILLSIFSIFTVVLCFMTLKWAVDNDAGWFWFFGSCVGILTLTVLVGWSDMLNPSPSAIDVYRGNTELQITYQNSTPIDTVVVFKEK